MCPDELKALLQEDFPDAAETLIAGYSSPELRPFFTDYFAQKGLPSDLLGGSLGGALGMAVGEHLAAVPGSKFYTVGRARYKPLPAAEEADDRNWINVLPLDLWRAVDLLRQSYDATEAETVDNFRTQWKNYVNESLLAHSGLSGTNANLPGTFTFDVKVMHQEKVRGKPFDLNQNLSRADAVAKLRRIRTVLTKHLPEKFCRALFKGWKHLDLDEDNPNALPFTDMSLEDLDDSNFENIFEGPSISGTAETPAAYLRFRFVREDGINEGLNLYNEGLEGGRSLPLEQPLELWGGFGPSVSKYVRLSRYGSPYSKFFNTEESFKLKDWCIKTGFVLESDDAFAFIEETSLGQTVVAFGGDVRSLLRIHFDKPFFVKIPNALPAFEDGRQPCPDEVLLDLDLAEQFIMTFRAKATYDLPDLSAYHQRLTKSPYADVLNEAVRCGSMRIAQHTCESSGLPHSFYLQCSLP